MRQLVHTSLLPIVTLRFTCSSIKKSQNIMDMIVGLILDTKLKFNEHLEDKINNCNRIIDSIEKFKKLSLILPRACLLTIYKAFVRPHLVYVDITFDKPNKESFKDWLEKVKYNATLVITDVIRGTT